MSFYQLILEKIKLNTGIDSINEIPVGSWNVQPEEIERSKYF